MTRESQTALKLTLAQASLPILVAAFTAPPPTHIQFFALFPGAHRPCNPLIDSPHAPPPLV